MSINPVTNKTSDIYQQELEKFLKAYTTPAFGSLTKKEIDLLVFEMMLKLNKLHSEDMYKNQLKLKLTNTKIRNLFYETELRQRSKDDLDDLVREVLIKPIILKTGEQFKLSIDNPLLKDHIKAIIKKLGHITDGSFATDIITLNDAAYYALVEEMSKADNQKELKQILIEAGATDTTIKGFLRYATKHLIQQHIGEQATNIAEEKFIDILNNILGNMDISSLKTMISGWKKYLYGVSRVNGVCSSGTYWTNLTDS